MEEKDDFEILEIDDYKVDVDIIYSCIMELFKYEKQIEKINQNSGWSDAFHGYIIKLEDYENLKTNIQYESLKEYFNDEQLCKQKMQEMINSKEIRGIKEIDKLNIKDSKTLIESFTNNKKYKLINGELWRKICKKENENMTPILYNIEYPDLTIYLNNKDPITFIFNDNILESKNYIKEGKNKPMNIAKSIIEYCNFINKMKENMEKKVEINDKGYLVSKTWIENWKNYVDFNKIKYNKENKNKTLEIIEQISENFKNVKKKRRLTAIETLYFKNIDIIEKFLQNDSLIIINESFYASVSNNKIQKTNIINFCYSDEIIAINLNKESIKFESKDFNELQYAKILFEDNNFSKQKKGKRERYYSIFSSVLFWSKSEKKEENDNYKYQSLEEFNYDENADDNNNANVNNSNDNDNDNNINNDNNNDNDNDNDRKEEDANLNEPQNIRDKFKLACPHIGLTNIGATCYMNATLQCMNHIEKFVNYFKYEYIDNKKDNLSSSFKILFDNLWPNDNNVQSFKDKYYAPEEFKNKISKMNPLFKGIAANDAKDLVNFIIMTLHSELNKPKTDEIYIANVVDQTNKDMVLNNFLQEFRIKNNSIIKDLFYAVNCNITECSICNKKIHNNQIYFFIIFPLEEVRKFKNENNIINNNNNYINNCQNYCNLMNYNYLAYPNNNNCINNNNYINNNFMNYNNNYINNNNFNNNFNYNNNIYMNMYNNNINYNNNNINYNINNVNNNINNNIDNNNISENNINNEVNIYDCFEYDKKINIMNGDNSMYCNSCKANTEALMYTNLVSGPRILILLLNRGKGKEFDVKIKFYEEINLYKYIDKKETGYKYKLLGVITHIGESSMSGHFIAYCRDFINNKWYKYNDAIVTEVEDFQNEVINFGMPYLLFYQKE